MAGWQELLQILIEWQASSIGLYIIFNQINLQYYNIIANAVRAGPDLGIGTGGQCPPKCPDCPTKHDAMQKSHISKKKKTTRILQEND